MMLGVVREARVAADVVEPDRPLLEQRAEHTVRPRQFADRGGALVTDTGGDEARETTTAVRDADRRVARVHLTAGSAHDAIEHRVEIRGIPECQQFEHLGGDGIGVDPCGHRSGC